MICELFPTKILGDAGSIERSDAVIISNGTVRDATEHLVGSDAGCG